MSLSVANTSNFTLLRMIASCDYIAAGKQLLVIVFPLKMQGFLYPSIITPPNTKNKLQVMLEHQTFHLMAMSLRYLHNYEFYFFFKMVSEICLLQKKDNDAGFSTGRMLFLKAEVSLTKRVIFHAHCFANRGR